MNPKKVYTIDPAFSHRMGYNFSENKGRVLENIIYLELLRRGKEVYYYAGKNECDFIIKDGLKIVEAIQVCYLLDQSNMVREIRGLEEAMQTYEIERGLIITYTNEPIVLPPTSKIEIVESWRWLLAND